MLGVTPVPKMTISASMTYPLLNFTDLIFPLAPTSMLLIPFSRENLIPLLSCNFWIAYPTSGPKTLLYGILAASQTVIFKSFPFKNSLIEEALSSPMKEAPTITIFLASAADSLIYCKSCQFLKACTPLALELGTRGILGVAPVAINNFS